MSHFKFDTSTLLAVAILAVTFFVQYTVLPVQQELYNPTRRRFKKVLYRAEFIIFALYTVMGVIGYLSFPGNVNGNILKNYPADDTFMLISRICLSFTLIAGCALIMFPLRVALERELFPNNEYSYLRSLTFMSIISGCGFIAALYIPGIIVVWSFVGALLCNATAYIFPSLMYLQQYAGKANTIWNSLDGTKRWAAASLSIIGIVLMGLCTYAAIYNVSHPSN